MLASRKIHLSVDKETARDHIVDRVENVRTTREDDRITIRSPTGVVLAYLSDHDLPDGETGTRLDYRTGASLLMYSFGSKAKRIHDVVSRYKV